MSILRRIATPPLPRLFLDLRILKGFKSNVLELRIIKDLQTHFSDLRILKELAASDPPVFANRPKKTNLVFETR